MLQRRTRMNHGLITASFLIFVVSSLASGCHSHETPWSAQSISPDRKLVAAARTENNDGGFGTGAQWTTVEIKQNLNSAKPIEVLGIDEGPDSVRNLTMTWRSPSHLHIAYKGGEEVLFQAVKALGADITVEHLPG
jgi:hypothetical protein